jgi:hypothetical protein
VLTGFAQTVLAQDAAVLLHRMVPTVPSAASGEAGASPGADSRRAGEIAGAVAAVFESRFAAAGGIRVYRSEETEFPADLATRLSEPESYLTAGRVELIAVRRETGFDGLLAVGAERVDGGAGRGGGDAGALEGGAGPRPWRVTLHAVNLTVGEIFHADSLEAPFGAELLAQVEELADGFARDLTDYAATLVTVRSEPSGAAVFLDGTRIGVTPLERRRTEPGSFRLRVEREGYLPRETQVSLDEGEKAVINVPLYQLEAAALVEEANALVGEFHSLLLGANLGFQPYGAQPDWFFPGTELLYSAKWRSVGGSIGMELGSQELERSLDTVLGERSETIYLDRLQVYLGGRYYPFAVRRRLDGYIGAAGGLSVLTTASPGNPPDYSETIAYQPYGRGELGVGFLVLNAVRLELFGGYHYQGRVSLFRKEPTFWGEPSFTTERFALQPFFAGLRIGYALYPANLRRGREAP